MICTMPVSYTHLDVYKRQEVGYQQMKKGGNRKEAIEKLTELIKVSPQNEEYYLDIINLHLQRCV